MCLVFMKCIGFYSTKERFSRKNKSRKIRNPNKFSLLSNLQLPSYTHKRLRALAHTKLGGVSLLLGRSRSK